MLAVDGWALTFGTARRGLGKVATLRSPLIAEPNVRAHPSTASVPITVFVYDGFDVSIKGLKSDDS